ncbi:mechanosensitive ion channel family protein [Psychrobacter sp. I-STPA10]|uniref:mechanosensitive ion channel family protein n=1 Tax=Psychrobacter sp. I-STPA10 TaxID=2585769 RepID=UPI001E30B296|nr:mechanosensitive ion channel domain-containing protein [Psychrobacter sp. I-STPA10]
MRDGKEAISSARYVSCLMLTVVIGIVVIYMSVMATDAQAAETNQASNQASSQIIEQPDTLTDYIQQQWIGEAQSLVREPNSQTNHASQLQANNALTGEYNQAYYPLTSLNQGLPPLKTPANLQTPLASIEFFQTAIAQKKFGLAAYALNLNSIPTEQQTTLSADLAQKLDYLLLENNLYLYDDLPDRPDGLIEPPIGSQNSIMGIPRRSIKLGYISYKSRNIPIFMERVRVKDNAPIWVFSSQTVINIDALYDVHKPAEFERYLPDWLVSKFFGISIWEYLALLLFMLLTLGLGWVFSQGVEKCINWYANHKKKQGDVTVSNHSVADFFSKITTPFAVTVSFVLVFTLVSGGLPSIPAIAVSTQPILWVCLVFSCLWLGIRIINFFANRYQNLQIENLDDEQFKQERKRRTYLSVFRRVFIFVMIIGGVWISLAEFADLEGLGKTLLTSAGIAGVILGVAAQPTLGNIIAGVQVAITQPVRIGDTVMLDGVWCEVEDLRYTYAVLKTWDNKRMIVPMKYFVTETLENWSHTNPAQSSAIYLYIDYGANIEQIRKKFFALVKAHELWDKNQQPELLITDVTEETIKMRCKVSSDGPQNTWILECAIREQMVTYLKEEQENYLPTERITLVSRT